MLWEEERNRFTFTDGVLYNQFLSVPDFETVRSYAEQMGVLIWANAQKRTVVVTREGHDPVKKVWNIFKFENDFKYIILLFLLSEYYFIISVLETAATYLKYFYKYIYFIIRIFLHRINPRPGLN